MGSWLDEARQRHRNEDGWCGSCIDSYEQSLEWPCDAARALDLLERARTLLDGHVGMDDLDGWEEDVGAWLAALNGEADG